MKIFVISGPSGIGKSHLISELSQKGIYPLEVYTDREKRSSESIFTDRIYLSKEEFNNSLDTFLYWFEFQGNRYGYKGSDIQQQKKQNNSVAFNIPPSYLPELINKLPEAIIIYLNIEPKRFDLLSKRMIFRDVAQSDSEELKSIKLEKIRKRIEFATEELKKLPVIRSASFQNPLSKIFTIQDNNSLYDEVIPYILEIL